MTTIGLIGRIPLLRRTLKEDACSSTRQNKCSKSRMPSLYNLPSLRGFSKILEKYFPKQLPYTIIINNYYCINY